MLNMQVIGCGAAGNKAVRDLIADGYNKDYCLFINSTAKDIPGDEFNTMIFGKNNLGGCGKERELGKTLLLQDMKAGNIDLDSFINPTVHAVIICGSTEGGTGSASIPIIARYINSVYNLPVIICLFFGFNDDARGMQNSIEVCQELEGDYTIFCISNARFLEAAGNNKVKAEKLANEKFSYIVESLIGIDIIPGSQNIDDTDLFKIVTTPGYMIIDHIDVTKAKNKEQYTKTVNDAIDYSSYMESPSKGVKRLGMVYNIAEDKIDNIDCSPEIMQSRYGIPYEYFTQIQCDNTGTDYVKWYVSGMQMPFDEIKTIYEQYCKTSAAINKEKDSFFDEIGKLKGYKEDESFDVLSIGGNLKKTATEGAKKNFFETYGLETSNTKKKNTKSEY